MDSLAYNKKKVTSDLLDPVQSIRHCFCTRQGGVSKGLYLSLNCGLGSADDRANVECNRARALAQLEVPGSHLITSYQAHTATAVFITEPWKANQAPDADGIVTNRPGLALGILTADCAPVLLADPVASVIGAAHAGWRGTIAGIIESTLELMVERGAKTSNIIAAIGPCIAQKSYEVGVEFNDRFVKIDHNNKRFFCTDVRTGKYHFNLAAYVRHRLERWGVKQISQSESDTYTDEGAFFSYRRSMLRGEDDYGRGISLIALAQ